MKLSFIFDIFNILLCFFHVLSSTNSVLEKIFVQLGFLLLGIFDIIVMFLHMKTTQLSIQELLDVSSHKNDISLSLLLKNIDSVVYEAHGLVHIKVFWKLPLYSLIFMNKGYPRGLKKHDMGLKLALEFRNSFATVIGSVIASEHFLVVVRGLFVLAGKHERFKSAQHGKKDFIRVMLIHESFLVVVLVLFHRALTTTTIRIATVITHFQIILYLFWIMTHIYIAKVYLPKQV